MIFGDIRCIDRKVMVRILFLIVGFEYYLLIKELGVRLNNNSVFFRFKKF